MYSLLTHCLCVMCNNEENCKQCIGHNKTCHGSSDNVCHCKHRVYIFVDGLMFVGPLQTEVQNFDLPVLQPCLTATLQGLIGNLLFVCKKEMSIKFRKHPPLR